MDFTHIYDFVEDIYCADNGHPSVAPVVLFKMVLISTFTESHPCGVLPIIVLLLRRKVTKF